jgi:hypothetical protein
VLVTLEEPEDAVTLSTSRPSIGEVETVKEADCEPAGIVSNEGIVSPAPERTTVIGTDVAAVLRLTVHVADAPPVRDEGENVTLETVTGRMVRVPVAVVVPRAAVTASEVWVFVTPV